MSGNKLTITEARRCALAAQGFDKPRPASSPHRGHMRNAIRRIGLLQLDFVNVLVPAHYLVMFSRLGPFDRKKLHRLIYNSPDFIEHWAHEASIVPVEHWPLLQYRREDFRPWPNSPIMKLRGKKKYLKEVMEAVKTQGAITAHDLPPVPGPKRKPGDWHRSLPRWALEYHFGNGAVTVADRLPNFQRIYDLPERVIDEPHFSSRVSRNEGQRALLAKAAQAQGVATLHDLADYFRMSAKDTAPRVAELVEEGVLLPISVDGWDNPAFLHRDSRIPRAINCCSLLSPFDPVVWFRPRAERLFDFHYRIEIYVPEKKRKWGYYVLPFLMDGRIVARVDLKADRQASTLLVKAAHAEEGVKIPEVGKALAQELRTLADWLGMGKIRVSRKGNMAQALRGALR